MSNHETPRHQMLAEFLPEIDLAIASKEADIAEQPDTPCRPDFTALACRAG